MFVVLHLLSFQVTEATAEYGSAASMDSKLRYCAQFEGFWIKVRYNSLKPSLATSFTYIDEHVLAKINLHRGYGTGP